MQVSRQQNATLQSSDLPAHVHARALTTAHFSPLTWATVGWHVESDPAQKILSTQSIIWLRLSG